MSALGSKWSRRLTAHRRACRRAVALFQIGQQPRRRLGSGCVAALVSVKSFATCRVDPTAMKNLTRTHAFGHSAVPFRHSSRTWAWVEHVGALTRTRVGLRFRIAQVGQVGTSLHPKRSSVWSDTASVSGVTDRCSVSGSIRRAMSRCVADGVNRCRRVLDRYSNRITLRRSANALIAAGKNHLPHNGFVYKRLGCFRPVTTRSSQRTQVGSAFSVSQNVINPNQRRLAGVGPVADVGNRPGRD